MTNINDQFPDGVRARPTIKPTSMPENNEAHIHYTSRGSGNAVLLIHGLGSSGADWAFQIAPLASRFRVIVPDLPGSGHSPALNGRPGIVELAEALWSLLDKLQISSANIVGFSLGGAVALEMALQRPVSVPALVLINSLASYRIDHWRKWCEARFAVGLVRLLGMRTMAQLLAGRSFPEAWQRPMRDRAVAVIGAVPAASYLAMAAALERWHAIDRLDALRSQILMIAAEHDFTPLAEKRALATRLGAQLVVVRGSRHGTPFDSIGLTNSSILALLTGVPLPGRDSWTRDGCVDRDAWDHATHLAAEHAAYDRPDEQVSTGRANPRSGWSSIEVVRPQR